MAAENQTNAGGAATMELTLLDQILENTRPLDDAEMELNKSYIEEFVRQAAGDQTKVSKDAATKINFWIAELDKKISAQLNEVMHAEKFQQLESTWRGLHYLVHESETGTSLKIRVMNATKRDLLKDLETAVEFDQSAIFKKIYEEEYGQLGGQPYGLLIGDYEFSRRPEDINLLKLMSNVAAAAHAPLISAASPSLFNLDSFSDLPNPRDLAKIFEGATHTSWRSFRDSEDSRYVALTLPHVLGRLPYGEEFKKVEEFNFEEAVDGKDYTKYLWMNAAWAYGARITNAFSKYGWFAKVRGVEGGGKVENLPVHTFPTDDGDVAMKCPTEIAISDRREFELSNLGFLPLLHAKNTDYAVFMGAQSCQKPKVYFDEDANANAELSARINFLLCVSRFAHYLKVMARDKIGSNLEVAEAERWLNSWISNYVCDPATAGDETKAKCPLADARVEVREVKGKPGWYEAVAWLRPHFQLETLEASMRLVAEVPKQG
ncbi:type VI secretion system contractile sheath large subunit [Blastopirellula sp. JC732]|uniref:Type VI secretion system contractile sheath large subunit n=1 Tax=Blastopirellula sediminis TaxID=2894196 RepID=A0A9X1MP95_9BACT|nr:type VI secretion system contractile sheath large subunit [Blastopirellula sediminis]MCC9607165.1 type VI secretion system contractile sheath large subunit [Blastopirellula sediminis]MCC9629542.1 type VI secretion system contractile sheath large subunit [Blastopirellula sediminis]